MEPTDPVAWAPLAEIREHTCLRCEAVFADRRDELDPEWDRETAVARLYAWWHEDARGDVGNEQGGAYVFAYLLEREGLVEPSDDDAPIPASLVDRRPAAATLDRWVWEDEQVFWWIAVRCGVHFSLVQYWLYEADIPVMRRNVPDPLLERVDAMAGEG